MDDLASAFESLLICTPVYEVDRNKSSRAKNLLSKQSGGMYSALVFNPDKDVILVYDNIFYPKAYSRKIRENNPDYEVTTLLTTELVSLA
jgi:hypothetical protein